MRKVPRYVPILAAIIACTIAGCSGSANSTAAGVSSGGSSNNSGSSASSSSAGSSNNSGSGGGSSNNSGASGGSSTAPTVLAYVPSSLQPSCSDTGTSGHLPGWVSGYADSLTCNLGLNTPAEVDYYFYNSRHAMEAAYTFASTDDSMDVQQTGGCATGSNEFGIWAIGGTTIGEISCPINNNNGVNLIWDDPNTRIIAVANAAYVLPADLYSWWQSNGASIDGSAQGAISS
jgi:hypothetical protein